MNVYALISLIAFMLCFFLGNFIYHKNPKSQLNIMVAVLCILVGFLAFTEFEYRQTDAFEVAFFWLKISTLWPFVPSVLLHISLIFSKKSILKNKLIYILIYGPAIIISSLALTTNLLLDSISRVYWGWTYSFPQNLILFNIMSFWTILAGFLAAFICFAYYLNTKNIKKKQAKYMFVGLYVPLLISLLSDLILPSMSLRIPEMTMVMSTAGIGLISYGIWRYRFPALTPAIAADKIVSTMSNFFILLNTEKKIINVNPATNDLLDYDNSELIGKSMNFILAEGDNILFEDNHELMKNELISKVETNFKSKNGKIIPVFLSISLIQSEENETLGIVCIGSDIVDIIQAKDKIKASLHEKELLLREVHHRVKNNLQIISSLLNLQSGYIKDKEDLELFKDSQSRVQSMAFIHEQLYQSSNFANIEFSRYIQNLLTYIQHYYVVNPSAIELKVDVENISLDINTAIPCGLIINELVTNSLKHAFPANYSYKPANQASTDIEEKVGEVYVGLHTYDANKYILVVSDNGIGPPENFDFRNTDTLGLELVNNLVNQLDGTIKLNRANGTRFEILFNKLEYKDRL